MTSAIGRDSGAKALLPRTSDQILGPFYPLHKEPDPSGDLTRKPGHSGAAQGQLLHVVGRVLDREGRPVQRGKLNIWQANSFGRYNHPNDDNPAPLDPCFEGFTVVTTDDNGYWRLKTVKPGAYPAAPGRMRPSHIHFEVFGKRERLVTQLYFRGDPFQDTDPWLQSSPRPDTILKDVQGPAAGMDPASRLVVFDIVLLHG